MTTPQLQPVAEIPVPGPAVRFDYQGLDSTANRLYISHMDAGHDDRVRCTDRAGGGHRVASESGAMSVFVELDTGLAAKGTLTIPYAHTVATDPRSHLVYLPLQDVGGQPMLGILQRPPPALWGPAHTRAGPLPSAGRAFDEFSRTDP